MNQQACSLKPTKILIIAMPYLGDVLLATPVFNSLRQAYPEARIDVLVFSNTVGMLEGNPDINHVITTPNRPTLADNWRLFKQIFRRYDLAIALQTGDRPFLYTLLAAPFRVNAVPPKKLTGWWKRFFVQRWLEFDNNNTHTVLQNLKLLDLISVPKCYSLIPPRTASVQQLVEYAPFAADHGRYAVLHTFPQWAYKRWTVDAWVEIGRYLQDMGLKLVLTGGPAPEDKEYVANIASQLTRDTINLAGQVTLAQLTHIIAQAVLFIGPDTGVTHLAAATGIPVIALYGPTNPVKWAPWPSGFNQDINPFHEKGDQHVNNVFLIQGSKADCVPCQQEGCERHRQSRSDCLDVLSSEPVKRVIEQILYP